MKSTIACVTLAVTLTVVAAACVSHRRPADVPDAMHELAAAEPSWRFYPASSLGLVHGFYVVAPGGDETRLSEFSRAEYDARRHRGVLAVQPYRQGDSFESGEHVARAGRLVLFGDPDMVRRAAEVLGD
jgi:hypothetical protein